MTSRLMLAEAILEVVSVENRLDIQNFQTWKKDPVTIAMMEFLKEVRITVEELMLNPATMLADRGQIDYARQLGMRDGIDMILELELEDIQEVDDNDETAVRASGI